MRRLKAVSIGITSIILIIASVAATTIVVAYTFSLFGGYNTVNPTVSQVGIGKINGSYLYVNLISSGTVNITSVFVDGYTSYISKSIMISHGLNQYEIPLPTEFKPENDSIYAINLGLSDGESVVVSASCLSS